MPTRRFDGVDDEIRCAIGSCDRNAGGTTFGILCKKNVNAVWQALIGLHNTLGTAVQAIEISNANSLYWDLDVTGQSVDGQVTVADGWVTLLFGKAAGATATARASKLIMSSGVWAHSDAGGTMTDGVMPGASGTVRFGEWEDGDDFNGWLGCAAVWASNLSDVAREAIAPGLQAWKNSNPVGLWAFNQDSVATAVVDLMGNGADQSAITGTSVDAAEVPPNFSFSLGITQAIVAATEADTSQSLGATKARALAAATQLDAASTLSGAKAKALGGSTETDSASVLIAAKAAEVGPAVEADTAAALAPGKVQQLGAATETDLSQPLTAPGGASISAAAEIDQAAVLGAAKTAPISAASETGQAQGLLVLRLLGIAEALEAEQASALGILRSLAIAAAQEGSVARTLSASKTGALGRALEVDAAQGFFFGSTAGKAEVSHALAALASAGHSRPMGATAEHQAVA